MESSEPLPHARSASDPLPHTRRRRASFSGKLLDFFSPKPKPLPEPPLRPVISRPQPLPSRIPVRPKRDYCEVATDENDPSPSSPRPRSRPRLASDASTETVRGYATSPKLPPSPGRGRSPRPLKSALKKSTADNSPQPDDTTRDRAPAESAVTSKSKESRFVRRLRPSSWMPLPHRNHHGPSPPSDVPSASTSTSPPKKHVAFAMEKSRAPPVLTRTASMRRLGEADADSADHDHWTDIASELDTHPSSPSSKRKAADERDPRYGALARPGSPIMSRNHSDVERRLPSGSGSKASGRKNKSAGAGFREVRLPHNALPSLSAFELPPTPLPPIHMGGVTDELLREFAREKTASFHPAVTKRGPAGVLQRISIDIVPNERHSTVWDANEQDTFAWGGTLLVRDAKPASFFYPRHCIQDVRIEFCMLDEPTSAPDLSALPRFPQALPVRKYSWTASYTGHRLARSAVLTQLDPARGISVEPEHTFVPPADPDDSCAWLVHFWVPVPLRLLAAEGGERCKTFVCRARVLVGDWETPKTEVPAGCTSVTIESLQSGRMLGRDTVEGWR
ncbi:hypothetical protein C8Q80DRAFT_1114758 [Daedaleopsis nitida]|nr:hypothetical protein C8Q80DRAFT_1114758 [Daedaleopsis nitida]